MEAVIENTFATASKKMLWAGYVVSALPVLLLLFSASGKFLKRRKAWKLI